MKKILFVLAILICMSIDAHAQDITIIHAEVITANGTFPCKNVVVYLKLTDSGMRKVYDENKTLRYKVSASWNISAYLHKSTKSNTFYPVVNYGTRRKNGETLEFECVDYDAAQRLLKRGVSAGDFTIQSETR